MEYRIFQFENMSVVYGIEDGQATFTLVPSTMLSKINELKMNGADARRGQVRVEPSMQIGIEGDSDSRDFCAGKTYKNRQISFDFGVPEFLYEENEKFTKLTAQYVADHLIAKQVFIQEKGLNTICTHCKITNTGENVIVLESVPSFTLSRLSPFVRFNDEAEISIYRMRNNWSAEGQLIKNTLFDFSLEDSWSGMGFRVERFGQVGSMPANGYLPWIAVEDETHGCVWAAEIEAPASWQIELCNVYNGVSISGGQADFAFGHWKKRLVKGETFTTHDAHLTVCQGNLLRACHNLVEYRRAHLPINVQERELPVMYNEYCTTWGKPTEQTVLSLLPACAELGLKYFVIDAGWYRKGDTNWTWVGDWLIDKQHFPSGLKYLTNTFKKQGITLGVWFEFERAVAESDLVQQHPDWLLTYNGKIIRHGNRSLLDMRKKEVVNYLRERVVGLLKESGARYIKIDYNEPSGIGVDGAESLGEGLRLQTEASLAFFRSLREEIPDLTIEICSSGGMRHEPLWLSIGNMCSFSDAHEGVEGAVIAANLHRFIPPQQLQIWAVIRDDYDLDDITFTLGKAMLGRICLSGNLAKQSDEKIQKIKEAIAFYQDCKEVLQEGETIDIKQENISHLRDIHGVQTLTRISSDGKKMLWYVYFIGVPNKEISIDVGQEYLIKDKFGNAFTAFENGKIYCKASRAKNSCCIIIFEK